MDVRIVDQNGDPWFVAKDAATALGYSNPSRSVKDHCKYVKEIRTTDSVGRQSKMMIIPESDVYRLIIRSNKKEAERFESWVVEEVLPAIRKHGKYEAPSDLRDRSKKIRVQFTDQLKEHGCTQPYHYINITQSMKENVGISLDKKKDTMNEVELGRIAAAEILARVNLIVSEAEGYNECKPICTSAAQVVLEHTTKKEITN